MNERITRTAAASIAALALGAGAGASIDGGILYTTPVGGRVFAEFVSSDAGATGSLYFLGSQQGEGNVTYAASDDAKNLGRFVFSNKGTPVGTSVDLGVFGAGTTLHFAYLITNGSGQAKKNQVTRSDAEGDDLYFGLGAGADSAGGFSIVGIEDIKGKQSDFDYNDLVIAVRAVPETDVVPAPGGAALAMVGWALMAPRAKRTGSRGGGGAGRV